MASLCKDPNGWRLLIATPQGRKPIRLGKLPKKAAENVKLRVELLVSARTVGEQPDSETLRWVASLPDELHEKIAKLGLVEERKRAALGQFIAEYIAKRTDLAPNTIKTLRQAERAAVQYFGAEKRLEEVTGQDARDFQTWLKHPTGGGYSEATTSKWVRIVKGFFAAARRARLIPSNPFEGVKAGSQKNESRQNYITRETIEQVIEACPNNRWRLLVALARFSGLRVVSEVAALRWSGVNWEKDRMTVYSPKTKTSRVIPIWPEVRPYLDEAFFENAKPGTDADEVFPDLPANGALATQLRYIICKAGVKPWPRLFQNLRASAATDIANLFPSHVAAEWCGHTEQVAMAHYRQTVDEHFERATQAVAHNAAHSMSAFPRDGLQGEGVMPKIAGDFSALQTIAPSMGVQRGLHEESVNASGAMSYGDFCGGGGAQCGAVCGISVGIGGEVGEGLREVAAAWESLTDGDRRKILAVVRRATERGR